MNGQRAAQGAVGEGSSGGAPLILLAEMASPVERALLTRWLRDSDLRPSTVLPLDGRVLDQPLSEMPPDTVVTAARVA